MASGEPAVERKGSEEDEEERKEEDLLTLVDAVAELNPHIHTKLLARPLWLVRYSSPPPPHMRSISASATVYPEWLTTLATCARGAGAAPGTVGGYKTEIGTKLIMSKGYNVRICSCAFDKEQYNNRKVRRTETRNLNTRDALGAPPPK
eukprot:scaffold5355_cov113-Isochrysis_galbana.AAC.1